MQAFISMREISRYFQTAGETVVVLDGVSLEIELGEFVVLTGPSGCGKSILLGILGLLDLPTSGAYFLAGKNVPTLSDSERTFLRNRTVSTAFQRPKIVSRLSVLDNVALPLRYRGLGVREAARHAAASLERVGMLKRAKDSPTRLSGGELQLVSMARALAATPEVLLADEPTASLDDESEARVHQLLRNYCQTKGATVLMVTHDLSPERGGPSDARHVCMRQGIITLDSGARTAPQEPLVG